MKTPVSICQFPLAAQLSRRSRRQTPRILPCTAALLLALFALFGSGPQALAATDTWLGSGGANWAGANWNASGNNPPLTGDTLVFDVAGAAGTALTDDLMTPGTFTVNGITFNSTAPAYTINPSLSGDNGFTMNSGTIANLGATLQTLNDGIVLNTTGTLSTITTGTLVLGGYISGAGGLVVSATTGQGTVILSGDDTYLGNTQEVSGTMNISGTLGASATAPTGAIQGGGGTTPANEPGTMNIKGATVFCTTLTEYGDTANTLNIINSNVTTSGGLTVNNNTSGGNGLLVLTSGTLTVGTTTAIGRDSNNFGTTIRTAAVTTAGLYIDGGTFVETGQFTEGTANSTANATLAAGSYTNSGLTVLQSDAGARMTLFSITGGTLNANGGITFGNFSNGGNEDTEMLLTGGTLNASTVTFVGNTGIGGGYDELDAIGGSIYIGSGGIVNSAAANGGTQTVSLSNVILGGTTNWSSSMSLTLAGTSTFQAANSAGTPENISLSGSITGAFAVTKTGGGTLTLTGSNSFGLSSGGSLLINGGVVNVGSTYALGVPTSGTIGFGGGTLQYTSANQQDYSSRLRGTSTNAISIDTNGQQITFATGLTTVADPDGLSVIDSSGGGSLTLTKAAGYIGPTVIGAGAELILTSNAGLGSTAISLGTGATLVTEEGIFIGSQSGAGEASLTLSGNDTLSMTDSNTKIGTVDVLGIAGNTSSILNLSGTNTIKYYVGGGNSLADKYTFGNGTATFNGGANSVIISLAASGAVPTNLTNIPLLYVPGGTLTAGDFTISAATPSLTFGATTYQPTLSVINGASGSNDELALTLLAVAVNYYWTDAATPGTATWSNVGNFATDHTGGTQQSQALASIDNVFLTGTSGPGNASGGADYSPQTLDGNYTINSLIFTAAASSAITLNSGTATQPLTIGATSGFADDSPGGPSYAAGIGVVVQAGSGAHIINSPINLGGNQAWEIDNSSSAPLTMNGVIGGAYSLQKTGIGMLILGASNTYTGGTIVTGGTLQLGTANALNTGALAVNGGTLDLNNNNQAVSSLSDGGTNTGVITTSTGVGTLAVNNTTPNTFGGKITDSNAADGAALSLNLTGTSTVTLSGSNSYSGLTTVNGGTLVASNNYALGSTASPTGGLNLVSGTTDFTSASPKLAGVNSSTGTVIVLGNSTAGSATTLTVGAGGALVGGLSMEVNGTISDLSSVNANAIGNLIVTGGSVLGLGGTNTFTGVTTISGNGSEILLQNSLALQKSTVNYINLGGSINFGTLTAATFGELQGSENLSLLNVSTAGVTLTVGGNNLAAVYAGVLSGTGGALVKSGTGVLTLSGANTYTGNTTVSGGSILVTTGGTINGGGITLTGGNMQVNGGSAVASAGSTVNQFSFDLISGSAAFNAGLNSSSTADGGLIEINSGNFSATSVFMGRTASIGAPSATTFLPPAAIPTNTGFVVTGGTVGLGSLGIADNGNTQSAATAYISGGNTTVTGNVTSGLELNNRWNYFQVAGGSLTVDGTFIDGQAGSSIQSELYMTGGVTTINGISYGLVTDGTIGGTANVVLSGGALYVGSGGIVESNTSGLLTANTILNSGTIGAAAPWSSSLPMTLFTSGSNVTFQAADTAGNANNITLTGVLSGSGGLVASGSGAVTLTNAETYTGSTKVNGSGTLIVSGSISGTASTTVGAGASLEVDGALISTATPVIAGKLSGTGTFSGATISGTASILAPGLSAANATTSVGTLTSSTNVTFGDQNGRFSIRLGETNGAASDSNGNGGDVDQLDIATGSTLTLLNTTLVITEGAAEYNPALNGADLLYVIVNGGAAGTGSGTDQFINVTNGVYTSSIGFVYDVFYGVNASNTGSGNDIDIELVEGIPEPGTWASVLAGIGILLVWRRSRRRAWIGPRPSSEAPFPNAGGRRKTVGLKRLAAVF